MIFRLVKVWVISFFVLKINVCLSYLQDIETWPLLQAFALDHVYCPTGFFTARYTVADITAPLEVRLFL
jgi:hypothetical protein